MKIDPAGSIMERAAHTEDVDTAKILCGLMQAEADELMTWLEQKPRIDLPILLFVLETPVRGLRQQLAPVEVATVEEIKRQFGAVMGATLVRKDRGHEQ